VRERRLLLVAGARPNFMKVAALHHALVPRTSIGVTILHTGQHAGEAMSEAFLRDLGLPEPEGRIELAGVPRAAIPARLHTRIGAFLDRRRPDGAVVVGDVDSTAAAAMAAAERAIPVAHVEAGLRCFDPEMPEERNRVIADHLAGLHFTTEAAAERNLRREGIAGPGVILAGNVMADTLGRFLALSDLGTPARLGLTPGRYALLTVHRAANVDDRATLARIMDGVARAARRLPVIFPVHPRTADRMRANGNRVPPGVTLCAPQSYLAFIDLLRHAAAVLTDSGGVQGESAVLRVPCVTLREITEQPVTVEIGANRLAGTDPGKIGSAFAEALAAPRGWALPPLWDGRAAERIADHLEAWLGPEVSRAVCARADFNARSGAKRANAAGEAP
jgi:UDP-N-acetylglucosamine 2-epimerase (non-hydrolysing)